ncbi:LptF/LptG family permease [candidate division WOR-3 bacterium]|nr:LptF/LptG family permease [candidate division WOR-3 bacterium]
MILIRYILKEHIAPFFIGLIFLTFILIMNKLFVVVWDIVGKGIPGGLVLSMLWLALPSLIALTVPMAVLVAVLMSFGRLSSDFEIVAIRAVGRNPLTLVLPPLIVSIFITAGMVWFNNNILPNSNHRLKNLTIDISQKKPAFRLQAMVLVRDFENYDILVRDIDPKTSSIYDITINEKTTNRTIVSKEGHVESRGDYVYINLYNGEIHETDPQDVNKYRKISFKQHTITIPLDTAFIRKERSYRGDRELSGWALRKRIEDVIAKNPTDPAKNREIARLLVEYHKKFSIPFSCIVFVLMGAPLAMRVRKGGATGGFGLSLLFFIFYYICLIGGEELGDRTVVPAWLSMWFPNMVLGILGIYLTIGVNLKNSKIFSFRVRH